MKKVFIFDFDGTLYSGEDKYCKIHNFINQYKRSFLQNLTDKEYEKIIKENPTWLQVYSGADIVELIYSFIDKYPNYNIDINDYRKWLLNVIEPVNIDKNQIINPAFLKSLCENFPVYIVSNSDIVHIKHYMKEMNIDPKWFKSIISNQFIKSDRTKKHYYQDILNWENCDPKNAFVFGDSITSDIIPAEKLGINAFRITDSTKIASIVQDIIKNFKFA